MSNGSTFWTETNDGTADGIWTRWNGAELNIDNATFRRTADETTGSSGGAFMLASYHGYANSVQTISLTNGGRIENEGQLWFGMSGTDAGTENQPGIRVVMTINNGHLDLTGGDEYMLNNDALPMRADLAFIYDWKGDADPTNDESFIINFTGPGDITVDGLDSTPLDTPQAAAGRGGIRIATNVAASGASNYGNDGNTQRSYQDLWNMGILRANNKSGLTGDIFNLYFVTTNNPGDNNYKLTSLVVAAGPCNKCKGDFNVDGKVDEADYVLWQKTLGSTTDLSADGNRSLNIDSGDIIHWYDHFGEQLGSGSGAGGDTAPEPSTASS